MILFYMVCAFQGFMLPLLHIKKNEMRRIIAFLVLSVAMITTVAQTGDLPRSKPSAQGLSTHAVNRLVDSLLTLPQTELHHLIVVRHGAVVAEVHPSPFRADDAHTLYSASKTFVAIAVGLAINDNRLCLDDRVAAIMHDFLPDSISSELAQMTIRNLLTMSSGITPDWNMRNEVNDWERAWLAKPVTKPGTQLLYDSMSTYMLSAIVQRVTGKTVLQLLNERIFSPLHITEVDWELSPDGVCTGGWGLRLQAESLAKVGLLLLHRGLWEGQQLIPEWWIDAMTSKHINYGNAAKQKPTDGNQGYGYQVWRCKWPTAYRADGAFGQYLVVDTANDMVVVILGMSKRGHDELAYIWNLLMPGIGHPDGIKDEQQLSATCRNASLPLLKGSASSPLMSSADFKLPDNKHGIDLIKIYREGASMAMRIYYNNGIDELIPLGFNSWQYGLLNGQPPYSIGAKSRFTGLKQNFASAACYAWLTPSQLSIEVKYVNWISSTHFLFDLEQKTVTIHNNFDSKEKPDILHCATVMQ